MNLGAYSFITPACKGPSLVNTGFLVLVQHGRQSHFLTRSGSWVQLGHDSSSQRCPLEADIRSHPLSIHWCLTDLFVCCLTTVYYVRQQKLVPLIVPYYKLPHGLGWEGHALLCCVALTYPWCFHTVFMHCSLILLVTVRMEKGR